MKKLRVLDLFSGIGGFSLGLERTGGFETVAFCEIEPFPRKVLAKHWPNVPCYEDVRTLTADRLSADGIAVDVITGGFPCQDISTAGWQAGLSDETRSGLWSHIRRLVGVLRPDWVIVENVANLLSGPSERPGAWFGRVLGDLAEIGYDAEWHSIPASNLGAHHKRDRIWVIANPCQKSAGRLSIREAAEVALSSCSREIVAGAAGERQPRSGKSIQPIGAAANAHRETSLTLAMRLGQTWASEPRMGRVAYGIPNGVERLAACGNAVIPQIPELIGYAILEAERASQPAVTLEGK